MRKRRPNLSAACFIVNVVGSITSYTNPMPNWLDYIVMVAGPIGAVSMAYYMHKDGIPDWFKELVFWVLVVLVDLAALGHMLPEAQ